MNSSMSRARDSQRGKVYRAERELPWSIFGNRSTEDQIGEGSIEEVTQFVAGAWEWAFHEEITNIASPPRIKDGRGTRIARGSMMVLNLPRWARTYTVVLHEVSHALVMSYDPRAPWHGREFCRVYLQLMKRWHPKREGASKALRDRFKANRVKYTRKRKMSDEQLRALRARGRQLAAARHHDGGGQSG